MAVICDFLECDDNQESRVTLGRIMLAGRWGYHVAARALYRTVVMNDELDRLLSDLQPVTTDMRCHACVHCRVKGSPDPSCLSAPIGKASLFAYTCKLVIGDIGLLERHHAELWYLLEEGMGRLREVRWATVGRSHSVWKEWRPILFPCVQTVAFTAEAFIALQDLHTTRKRSRETSQAASTILPPPSEWSVAPFPHKFIRILSDEVSPTAVTFALPTKPQAWSHLCSNIRKRGPPTLSELNRYTQLEDAPPWIRALIDAWPLECSA